MKKIALLVLVASALSSCGGSDTCGMARCDSFKFFPEPKDARTDKEIYSCIRTDSDKVTSYVLKDGDTTLVDCEDKESESDCRFKYNEARENACKK